MLNTGWMNIDVGCSGKLFETLIQCFQTLSYEKLRERDSKRGRERESTESVNQSSSIPFACHNLFYYRLRLASEEEREAK